MRINFKIFSSISSALSAKNLRVAVLDAAGLRSRLLLQIHDELVLEVAPGEVGEVTELVRREMAGAADLTVPLDVSVGYGPNWLVAH